MTGSVQFDSPCVECGLVCIFSKSDFPRTFGHIATADGLKAYTTEGTCEWCSLILADFAVMGNKGDFLT